MKYILEADQNGWEILDGESSLLLAWRRPPVDSTSFRSEADMLAEPRNKAMHAELENLVRRANRT